MKEALVRFITSVVLLLVAVACAWWAGHENASRAWEARQAEAAREATRAIDREWERGEQAALQLRGELDAQRTRYTQLEGAYRDYKRTHPLLAGTGPGAGPGHAVPTVVADVLPAGEAPPAPPAAPGGDGGDPALTVGAVWLWNEALIADHDPSGAVCAAGVAEASGAAGACDAASGVTLGDAWDNHLANARICAANRLAYQRLIDYIQQAEGGSDHD
jgi:hypothetical protein